MIEFLLERFEAHAIEDALVWRDEVYSYGWLLDSFGRWRRWLHEQRIGSGCTVTLEADFSPDALALLLALVEGRCIITPMASSVPESTREEFREVAEIECTLRPAAGGWSASFTGRRATHPLLCELRAQDHPGLILFSSGSTGVPKAVTHDFSRLLRKFHVARPGKRMLAFLLFDHIGGINTAFASLGSCGCLVLVEERSPAAVCSAVEKHEVQVLPTTPTFLNLLLLSEAYLRYDLSSLERVTYGTEPMPPATLRRLRECLPSVELHQTYGLSEVGILRSKSRSSDSLWVKLGGEGFETRIVDGVLEVRAESSMLGYLNAPSPFSKDGWLRTGDLVEQEGEFFRFVGRESEVVNVGGEKVHPREVEDALESLSGVVEAVVWGEANPITGNLVCATVSLSTGETQAEFRRRMRLALRDKLPAFKIPQKVTVTSGPLHSERFKKLRRWCEPTEEQAAGTAGEPAGGGQR
ncbi:MAG: fatty acid--CoA ligase family protein [Acidobacteriota bacterium]